VHVSCLSCACTYHPHGCAQPGNLARHCAAIDVDNLCAIAEADKLLPALNARVLQQLTHARVLQ
jgi:hypothetical protein